MSLQSVRRSNMRVSFIARLIVAQDQQPSLLFVPRRGSFRIEMRRRREPMLAMDGAARECTLRGGDRAKVVGLLSGGCHASNRQALVGSNRRCCSANPWRTRNSPGRLCPDARLLASRNGTEFHQPERPRLIGQSQCI